MPGTARLFGRDILQVRFLLGACLTSFQISRFREIFRNFNPIHPNLQNIGTDCRFQALVIDSSKSIDTNGVFFRREAISIFLKRLCRINTFPTSRFSHPKNLLPFPAAPSSSFSLKEEVKKR
jgi:hypothetical protein